LTIIVYTAPVVTENSKLRQSEISGKLSLYWKLKIVAKHPEIRFTSCHQLKIVEKASSDPTLVKEALNQGLLSMVAWLLNRLGIIHCVTSYYALKGGDGLC